MVSSQTATYLLGFHVIDQHKEAHHEKSHVEEQPRAPHGDSGGADEINSSGGRILR